MRNQVVSIALICALFRSKGCSQRDLANVSVTERGVVQILLPERKCDFQIDVLTIGSEPSYPRSLNIRECTAVVVIRELSGHDVLIRVPGGEVINTTPPDGTKRDVCRASVDEAVDLHTPFIHGEDYIHPAKIHISRKYSWPSRTQLCNDDRIQSTSCSNVSCRVSSCVRVIIPETLYLYTAYHEETCNTDSSNDTICAAIQTHFNGTEWYRQDVTRHCVAVAGRGCLPNCNSLYNATGSSTVHCNFTSGQCSLSINQSTTAAPWKPPPDTTLPNMTIRHKYSILIAAVISVVLLTVVVAALVGLLVYCKRKTFCKKSTQ